MKKVLGIITLLNGLRGAKKTAATNKTWYEDTKDFVKMIRAARKGY